MTIETLTNLLAKKIMGWEVAPNRFLVGNRRWLARWRFQPAEKLEDAFQLLDKAAPQEYTMGSGEKEVRVRIAGLTGEARERSRPRAIAFAVARAIGIDVDSLR